MTMPSIVEGYVKDLYPDMFMPAVNTSSLPQDVRPHVEEGIRRVREGDPMGVVEERYDGNVPVHVDNNPPYAGVTEFKPGYDGPEAKRMGISNRVPPRWAKRVGAHEARHVRSEKLLKYADIHPAVATLIMESYAEFGEFKALKKVGKMEEASEILNTTPYHDAVKFGVVINKYYRSDKDGKAGYEAFIRDIFRNKSMSKTLGQLKKNIRESIGVYAKAA